MLSNMLNDTLHSWGKSADITCGPTGGTCAMASFASAAISDFYTAALQDATTQMQAILNTITPDPNGRELCFLNTKNGLLLAWATHRTAIPPGSVTANNHANDIAAALGLVNLESADAVQA